MRTALLPVLVLILLAPAAAAQDFLYDRESLELELSIQSAIRLTPADAQASYVRAHLLLLPKDSERQAVHELKPTPDAVAQVREDEIFYEWQRPAQRTIPYGITARVTVTEKAPPLRATIPFPAEFPEELSMFTQPTTTIDSANEAIRAKARELAQGEDDLIVVLFRLVSWVEQNIQYDLSTLTADVSQPASWVLRNRVGVCDEMTSLFIAMARSLGIPARFVSGISYTTHPAFEQHWLPHGWAEVYVPGAGWVPFDPTFQEFGTVDATHIALATSLDPTEPASRFEWLGPVQLTPDELTFTVTPRKIGKPQQPQTRLRSAAARDMVRFGSYNVITTTVENLNERYVATTLRASSPPEVALERDKAHVLLKPLEKVQVPWIAHVDSRLQPGYLYTMPIIVTDERNHSSQTSFTASEQGVLLTQQDARALAAEQPATPVSLSCAMLQAAVKPGEELVVRCHLKNKGEAWSGQLCVDARCTALALPQADERVHEERFRVEKPGRAELRVQLRNGEGTATTFVPYEALDQPQVSIAKIESPAKLRFDEQGTVAVNLRRTSYALPQQMTVELRHRGIDQVVRFDTLEQEQALAFRFMGSELAEGQNNITLAIRWQDRDKQLFEQRASVLITLEELTFMQRVRQLVKRIGRLFG